MTARVERGGLVIGERSRPVCGPLWVLKLCIGAFYRVPQPEDVCFGFLDTGNCIYMSEMQIRNDVKGLA